MCLRRHPRTKRTTRICLRSATSSVHAATLTHTPSSGRKRQRVELGGPGVAELPQPVLGLPGAHTVRCHDLGAHSRDQQ
eukprot:7198918-Alexandrium_andersonii.AAC.1